MKLFFELLNYKKIKSLKGQLESGNLYFISGGNEVGKTSFLRALGTLLTADNKNKHPISFGEDKCVVLSDIDFESPNKQKYTVKFEMDETKETFLMIKPDGKATSSKNEIRDIFKFNDFSIDDWFGWGLTADGRKKQATIIRSLFPEEVNIELDIINGKINPKTGITYKKRTENNTALKLSNTKLAQSKLSLSEENNLSIYESKNREITTLKEEIDKITNPELLNELSTLRTNAQIIRTKKEAAVSSLEDFKTDKKRDNDILLKQIEELQGRIEDNNHQVVKKEEATAKVIDELGIDYSKLLTRRDEIKASIPENAELLVAEQKERLDTLNSEIESIPYNDLIYRKRVYDEELKNNKEIENNGILLQKELDELKARKTTLFSSTKLPLTNIQIVDDECMFVNESGEMLSFTEEHVSYSQGGLPIAEMLMEINKETRIVMLGKASEYDDKAIDKLAEIAKKYDGIIVADKVLADNEPLKIQIFESLN